MQPSVEEGSGCNATQNLNLYEDISPISRGRSVEVIAPFQKVSLAKEPSPRLEGTQMKDQLDQYYGGTGKSSESEWVHYKK